MRTGRKCGYHYRSKEGLYLNGNANPHNDNSFDSKYLYHNKAFLIESPDINASQSRMCIPVFTGIPTDTQGICEQEAKGQTEIYDLLGRKVEPTRDGLYILDRKKVITKAAFQ